MARTKGLKIAHMTNFAPDRSGMYMSVEELMYRELEVGYDAKIVDVVKNNPLRLKECKNYQAIKDGLVIGAENDNFSQEADI